MLRILIFCSVLSVLSSCGDRPDEQQITDTSTDAASMTITYAENLQIYTDDRGIERIGIINPFNGKMEFNVPVNDTNPHRIICKSATINGMIAELDCRDQLVGISKGSELFDSGLIEKFKKGQLQEFGDDQLFSIEKIVGSKANTLIYNGYNKELDQADKLRGFHISLIPLYDWKEIHPLGKAEWIKLIGILCGKQKEATDIFNAICNEYERLSLVSERTESKPRVISGNLTGDIWYAPMGDSYMAELIRDAGGEYVYKGHQGTGSVELSIEQVLIDNRSTDIWINPGIPDKKQLLVMNPNAKHMKAFNRLYCYSANMNKYWEQSALHPERVLHDLIKIFHPELEVEGRFNYYKEVS